MAMQLVGKQEFGYIKYLSRSTQSTGIDIGLDVAQYAQEVPTCGQVQALPRQLFEAYGLDLQKNYIVFYVSQEIIDVTRDVSGDKIKFAGNMYNCLSQTNWLNINGWTGVVAIQVD